MKNFKYYAAVLFVCMILVSGNNLDATRRRRKCVTASFDLIAAKIAEDINIINQFNKELFFRGLSGDYPPVTKDDYWNGDMNTLKEAYSKIQQDRSQLAQAFSAAIMR